MRHFRYPRLRYAIALPQIIHVGLILFYPKLVEMLNVLQRFDLVEKGHGSSDYIHLVVAEKKD